MIIFENHETGRTMFSYKKTCEVPSDHIKKYKCPDESITVDRFCYSHLFL